MTTIDPFERELPGALTDLAEAQTPDYFVDLLGRTARTRQRPTWAIPGRWISLMPAITTRPALAIVAIAIVAILGGAFLLNRSDQNVGVPIATPTASPAAAAEPYPSPKPMPSALAGGWLAPAHGGPGIDVGDVTVIQFGSFDDATRAADFGIDGPGALMQPSRVREVAPGVVEITSTGALGGCSVGDVGRYQWATKADDTWLTLTKVEDACAMRGDTVPGTWVRSGAHNNHGGQLVAANFKPYVSFTLPKQDYTGWGMFPGSVVSDRNDATFKVWEDPDGFVDYCNDAQGRVELQRGIDPFLAFLKGPQSGLTVSNEREITVDGHRAVLFDMGGKPGIKPPCWTNPGDGETNQVLQWIAHNDTYLKWARGNGDPGWPIVVTEVDGHTLVFEVGHGTGTSWSYDQSLIDSVRFLDALPTPPAS